MLTAPDVGTDTLHYVTVFFTGSPGTATSVWPPDGGTAPGSFYMHGIIGPGCTDLYATGCKSSRTYSGENEPLVVTYYMNPGTLTLGSTSGTVGSTVTFSGSFQSADGGMTAGLTYDGLPLIVICTDTVAHCTSDGVSGSSSTLKLCSGSNAPVPGCSGAGAIPPSLNFVVPASSGSPHAVLLTTSSQDSSIAKFTVTTGTTLGLSPTSGTAGSNTVVTLSGSNYRASFTYNYCVSSSATSVSCVSGVSSFTSTAGGAIPGSVTITVNQVVGTYYVIVYNPTTNLIGASATFTES